ncbi:MAG: hypothetical protein ABSA86_11180 [Oryzomonas sp.]
MIKSTFVFVIVPIKNDMDNSAATSLPAIDNGFLSLRPVRFLGFCGLFFVLAHWLPDFFFAPLNRATAYLSGECLAFLGKRAEVAGDIVSLNGFRVWITAWCFSALSSLRLRPQ